MILTTSQIRARLALDSDISDDVLTPQLTASELQIAALVPNDYANATGGSPTPAILDRVQRAQVYIFQFFLIPLLPMWQLRRYGMVSQEQSHDAAGSTTTYKDTSKLDPLAFWRLGMQALLLPVDTLAPGQVPPIEVVQNVATSFRMPTTSAW